MAKNHVLSSVAAEIAKRVNARLNKEVPFTVKTRTVVICGRKYKVKTERPFTGEPTAKAFAQWLENWATVGTVKDEDQRFLLGLLQEGGSRALTAKDLAKAVRITKEEYDKEGVTEDTADDDETADAHANV